MLDFTESKFNLNRCLLFKASYSDRFIKESLPFYIPSFRLFISMHHKTIIL